MRLLRMVIHNVVFQFKHGFYLVYLIISLSYVALLRMLPYSFAQKVFSLIIFSDISFLGLFFIGAIIFLERDQGIMQALFVTPLRITEYILSEVFSLAFLSLIMGMLIGFLRFGLSFSALPIVLATFLASTLFTLFGIAIAVKQRRITSYFVICFFLIAPFFLPLLSYFDIYNSRVLQIFPTAVFLNLLDGSFKPVCFSYYMYALANCAVWIAVAWYFTTRRFTEYVINKTGEIQ